MLEKNPIRYRSYYYDNETGFYYLNARYYDPEIRRFISADTQIAGVSEGVSGYNLFAYCDNDPVNKTDASGCWPDLNKIMSSSAAKMVAKVELDRCFKQHLAFTDKCVRKCSTEW